ncbi:MAG TPA: acyltransferase [Burkholderiaceae bacterium]|nr:acyltransferase [Burkholderiaceae bacterium]
MSAQTLRMPLIDAFKAVASQLIVLHHLAFYGPMSDWTHQVWPALVSWLSQDARMAVQVFLVISGFLMVRSLAAKGVFTGGNPWALLRHRYLTIAGPYAVAIAFTVMCSWLARQWMDHDSVPGPATAEQFVWHVLLLHSLLGFDSLSAGVWYVAIDFQLFALMLALLWLGRRWAGQAVSGAAGTAEPAPNVGRVWPTLMLVVGLGLASLWWFNRVAGYDNWAVYFFGAYASGALAWWVGNLPRSRVHTALLALAAVLAVAALALDWRTRIAVALSVAGVLALAQAKGWLYTWPRSRVLDYLGKISYGVFLMNFPVGLVVNAAFTRFAPADVLAQTVGVMVAWLATVAAGAVFFHAVEQPLRRFSAGLPAWGRFRLAGLAGMGWLRISVWGAALAAVLGAVLELA